MTFLSFVAIVKNEAACLGRCLKSVQPYVDELIVVDTGSSDRTIEIARELGAQVHEIEWQDDFAAARNAAIGLATGEWILTLDADEVLEVQDIHWVDQLRQKSTSSHFAFAIALRDATSTETAMHALRLFRNDPDLQYRDRYHEHLTWKDVALGTNHPQVVVLDSVELIHYGYAAELLAPKSHKRIPILEAIRVQEGLNLMLLWTLSGMYEAVGDEENAQGCYAEAWERLFPDLLAGEQPTDQRSVRSWLYSLGVRSLQAEDLETVSLICQRGNEWFSDYPPLTYLSGLFLKQLGFPLGAIPYFEQCLAAGQTGQYFQGEPFDKSLVTLYPALELGGLYRSINQPQKAIAFFEQALVFDSNNSLAKEQKAIAQQVLPTL